MEDPGGAGGISPAWLQDDDSLPLHSFVESLLAAPEHEFIDPAGGAVGIGAADAQSSDKTQALARLLAAASDYAANLQFDPSTSDGMQLPQLTSLLGHHTVMQLPTSLHHTHVLGSLPSDPCLAGFGGNTPLQQLVLTFHNVLDNKKEFCRPQQPTNWRLIDNTFVTLRCDYTSRGVGGPRSWPRPTPIGEEGLALIQLAHKRCIYRLSRATPSAQLPAHQGCLGGAVMSQQQQQQSTAGTAAEASPLLEVDMEVCWTFVARRPVVSTPALAASGRLTAAAAAAAEARRAGGGSGALTPATSPATRYWRPYKTRDPAGDKHDACWVVGCVAALEFTGVELARRPPSLGTLPSLLPRVTPQTLPQQQQQQLGPLLLRECGAIHGLATVSCGHSQQNTYQQENAAAAAATAGPSLGIWPEEHVQARQGELPHPSQAQNASLIQAAAPPTTITQGVMVVTALAEQGCLFALVPPEIRAQVESAAAEGAATAEEEEEEEEEGAAAAAAAACGAEEEPSTEAFSGSDRKVASPPPWELCEALVQQQLRAAAGQQHGARSSATSHHGCRVPRHLLHRAEDVAAAVSHGLLEAAAGLPGPNTCTALEQQLVRLDAHMREVTQLLGQAQEGPPAPALVVTLQRVREPWFLGRSLLHLLASSVAVWGPAATHTPQGQMGPAVRSASLRKLWAGAEARGGAAALLDAVNRNDATPWLTACHFALPEVLEFLLSCQELTLRRMLVPSKRGMLFYHILSTRGFHAETPGERERYASALRLTLCALGDRLQAWLAQRNVGTLGQLRAGLQSSWQQQPIGGNDSSASGQHKRLYSGCKRMYSSSSDRSDSSDSIDSSDSSGKGEGSGRPVHKRLRPVSNSLSPTASCRRRWSNDTLATLQRDILFHLWEPCPPRCGAHAYNGSLLQQTVDDLGVEHGFVLHVRSSSARS